MEVAMMNAFHLNTNRFVMDEVQVVFVGEGVRGGQLWLVSQQNMAA